MTVHDPFDAVDLLRNHLAIHDKPISFLFGAGASSAINIAPKPPPGQQWGYTPLIPATAPLTALCKSAAADVDKKFVAAWDLLEAECMEAGVGSASDIESLLSRARAKLLAAGTKDQPLGLTRTELATLEQTISKTIAAAATPHETTIPSNLPHDDFARWIRQASRQFALEVFTTNYDILLERSLERARVPLFDGFVGSYRPYFLPESLEDDSLLPPSTWVRIWKLHGSVNWSFSDGTQRKRIVRGEPGISGGQLILPSHLKYDESRKQPYQSMIERFARMLRRKNSLLVTVGYSYRDQHIDSIIFEALESSPLTHVVALKHGPLEESHPLVALAKNHANFLLIAKNAGCIRRRYGTWLLSRPIDRKTYSFMDEAFDSKAVPEDGEALEGSMVLGDFSRFARFLGAMEATRVEE